jgi:predicted nucleotidyltransferase component of viral defense system
MTDGYPRSFGSLAAWASANRVTMSEARQRFVQYVALCGIASVPPLRHCLVFKGGNALDFVWQPNRSTVDLDFSVDPARTEFQPGIDSLRTLLGRGLSIATSRFGVAFAITSLKQQPPGAERTFITYAARVGYALPDEARLLIQMANKQNSPHMLPIDISINEPICAATVFTIDERHEQLRVSTLEDIVSEKLRALLQQSIRGRNRKQDILDIAVAVRVHAGLNRAQVAAFLHAKADARDVPVSKSAFRDREIAERARVDYDALESTTRTLFIPFDEAIRTVLAFVDELPIPDN